jgi:outer membrane protein TolC
LSACEAPKIGSLTSEANKIFSKLATKSNEPAPSHNADIKSMSSLALDKIIKTAPASTNSGGSFQEIVRLSVESNPEVLSAKARYKARLASIDLAKTSTEFKLSGILIGGVEDVTDETAGVAAILNGKKVIYDGGKIVSQISKEEFLASAALADFKIKQNEIMSEALSAWVNLKRYATLNEMIQSRLDVLAPLIMQLEEVAKAGVGDASQVAAAERTVNMIRVTERDIVKQLAQASVRFKNIFGISEPGVPFLGSVISTSSIPSSGIDNLVSASPLVTLHYARYGAAVANLNSVIAKDSFDVGLEAKIQRPFGGSGYDSDESIGFVVRKTFRDGGSLEAERRVSEARVDVEIDMLRSSFRSANETIKESQEIISAISDSIQLANSNAKNAKEEINYLRQQLIIGQSTLDTVLLAEARLYEAEAKSINFASDQYMAEITILATLGILAPIFEVK